MGIEMRTLLTIACLIIGGAADPLTSQTLAAQRYEMLGLSPGMPPDTVQKIISSKYGDLNRRETADEEGRNVSSITASRSLPNGETIERIAVLFTDNNPRAWFLGHEIIFDEHKGPLVRNLQTSLIAKYGRAGSIYQAPGDHTIWQAEWLFEPSGKQIYVTPGKAAFGFVPTGRGGFPCGSENVWFGGDAASAGGLQLALPGDLSPLCGVSIVAKTAAPFNDSDVTRELVVRPAQSFFLA